MNSYSQQYIDHDLFKQTLLNNYKPQKISFDTISVKNQQISTNKITKNNIEFLKDKRYIKDINQMFLIIYMQNRIKNIFSKIIQYFTTFAKYLTIFHRINI